MSSVAIVHCSATQADDEILAEIRKCTKSVCKSSVEEAATMRAWSAKNDLDMDKYRQQVQQELDETNDKKEKGTCIGYTFCILKSLCIEQVIVHAFKLLQFNCLQRFCRTTQVTMMLT